MAARAAAAKKPKRGFMDGYRTYDPRVEGFGSVDDWMRQAEAALGIEIDSEDRTALPPRRGATAAPQGMPPRCDPDLVGLGLDAMPADQQALKSAFRRALIPAHPDHGGSRLAMEAVTACWCRLAARLRRLQANTPQPPRHK